MSKFLIVTCLLFAGCDEKYEITTKRAKVITCTQHFRVPTKCGKVAAFLIEDTGTKERFWATHPDISVNENETVKYAESGWVSLEINGEIIETKRLVK